MSVLMPYSVGQYKRETYRRHRLWIFAHTTVVSTDLTPFYLSRHSCPAQLSSAPDPHYRLTATSYLSLTNTGMFLETNNTQGLGAPGCRAEVSEARRRAQSLLNIKFHNHTGGFCWRLCFEAWGYACARAQSVCQNYHDSVMKRIYNCSKIGETRLWTKYSILEESAGTEDHGDWVSCIWWSLHLLEHHSPC